MAGLKKRIDIEQLLRWAYRDELPKEHASVGLRVAGYGAAWGGIERYGELLTLVDGSENRWGVVPDFSATVVPHPDAIRVGEAVAALDALVLDLPEDWNPLGDWRSLGDEAGRAVARAMNAETYVTRDGVRQLKTRPSRLIRKHAVLGGAPCWQFEEPQAKVECGSNGKPKWFRRTVVMIEEGDPEKGIKPVYREVEVNGTQRDGHPHPDAYQKTYYDPDPAEIVVARAEYEVWRAALDVLAIDLEGQWHDHEVIHSQRPWRPWETGDLAQQRVWQDLTRPAQVLTLLNGVWGKARPA